MNIAIVGAGITGLTAAHDLVKDGHAVTVYEKERIAGGLMAAFPFAGTQLDIVYHHIFVHSRAALDLIEELGMGDEMLWRAAPSGYFHGGAVHRLATGWDLLRFRPLSLLGRIRFGLSVLRARRIKDWRALDDVTAVDWLVRICGRDVYRVMWEPLLRSKFGDAYDQVSAAWFWYKLQQRGSQKGQRGPERLGYLEGSFGRLADALVAAIEERQGGVRLDTPVEGIAWNDDGFTVAADGQSESYDRVLFTAAPQVLLRAAPNLPEAYRDQLAAIDYAANLCMILALDRPLSDTYWMNISDERFPFGGIIEHTNLVPAERYEGSHVAYITRYLPREHEHYGLTDDELLDVYAPFLAEVSPGFDRSWVRQAWVTRSDFAAPITPVGYGSRVPELATPVPGLFMGNMCQLYPEDRGVDCGVELGHKVAALVAGDGGEGGGS